MSKKIKAEQTQTAAPSNQHPEILNGDLSAFAGTWINYAGHRIQLRANGTFNDEDGTFSGWGTASGFELGYSGSTYKWNLSSTEYISVLYPVGVDITESDEVVPTDNTKVRINLVYNHISIDKIYYRTDEAASQSLPQEPAELTGEWHSRSITGSCHG